MSERNRALETTIFDLGESLRLKNESLDELNDINLSLKEVLDKIGFSRLTFFKVLRKV